MSVAFFCVWLVMPKLLWKCVTFTIRNSDDWAHFVRQQQSLVIFHGFSVCTYMSLCVYVSLVGSQSMRHNRILNCCWSWYTEWMYVLNKHFVYVEWATFTPLRSHPLRHTRAQHYIQYTYLYVCEVFFTFFHSLHSSLWHTKNFVFCRFVRSFLFVLYLVSVRSLYHLR